MVRNDYETLSQAMNGLAERGYEKDLTDEVLRDEDEKYCIVETYRFEGMTNPDDSSVLYAIESDSGGKGIIVDAYNAGADTRKTEAIKKLKIKT